MARNNQRATFISIHSFRRGAGKSALAANVATSLALGGRRVGIVDIDVAAPSIHVFFDLPAGAGRRTVNDFLLSDCALEEVALDVTDRLPIQAPGRLFVFPASDHPNRIALVMRRPYEVARLSAGLEHLPAALGLDCLLVDTRAGLDDDSLLTFALSDALAVVLRTDQQDFQGTAVVLDLARRLDVPRLALVVNQAPSLLSPAAIRTQIAESYHWPVSAVLPFSPELQSMAGAGLFVVAYPQHPLAQQLRRLAAELAGDPHANA
jgi:septum site-determining protein MinD